MATITKSASEIEEYRTLLRERFTPVGTRVYVQLKHFTANNTRYYDVYVVKDGRIERITAFVAWATGYKYDLKREAIRTQNDGLSIAQDLSRRLYGGLSGALVGERLD